MRPSQPNFDDYGFSAERLADATHVCHGPDGSGALRQAGYVLYVVALFGAFWGVAFTRSALLEVDVGSAMTTFGWPLIGLGCIVVSGLVVVIARRIGQMRGPAVPSLPWIDLVASTSIDRALVLKESWHVALVLITGSSSIGGVVLGLSGAITGAWSPPWIIAFVVGSTALGFLAAKASLAGQASDDAAAMGRTLNRWTMRSSSSLRSIRIDRLREQSARSALVHGSVIVGDLRVAQLTLRPPRASARLVRLRATGPLRTIIRRDLLGYRRAPSRIVTAAFFIIVGVGGICWAVASPGTSVAVALLAAAAVYGGCGLLCDGLRLQSDTAGAPTLIGVAPRIQLLAHLVAPSLGSLVVGLPIAVGGGLLLADSPGTSVAHMALTCLWVLSVVALSVASHAWAAFRRSVPFDLVTSGAGPAITALWHAFPMMVVSIGSGALTGELAGNLTWWPFAVVTFATAAMIWLAVTGLADKTDAHRL